MARVNELLLAFNRGLISRYAKARVDIKRLALSAEEMVNWLPKVLGSMSMRPGFQYLFPTRGNATCRQLPFVYAVDDTAMIELTPGFMRVRVNDALVTRPSVSSAVANGGFNTDLASWTDNDDVGGVSQWVAGGYMQLVGDGVNAAIRDQQVTVAAGDQNKEHALRIDVQEGACYLRIGTTVGLEDYVSETVLNPGLHSIAFTPTGNFWIRVFSRAQYRTLVDSIAVEAAGVMEIATPWATSANLNAVRADQSGDVIFVACDGVRPMRIERRSTTSWSVADYVFEAGPFRPENLSPTRIAASGLTGTVTLTATKPLFRSTHVGALWRLTSTGQNIIASISAEDTFSAEIRVTGVGTDRAFTIIRSGTWVATVTLQRSIGAPGDWTDVTTYATNGTVSYNDGLDNQIIYYRIGVKLGDYTSGTVALRMSYPLGSLTGWVRIIGYTSSLVVTASVIQALGSTDSTAIWAEGEWSAYRGYPSTLSLHESRLWLAGKSKVWASVTDAYSLFDDTYEGDAGPISRTIGAGPVDVIRWSVSGQRLIFGAQNAEWSARSSSLDEPLTPTNFNLKAYTTRGSANTPVGLVDSSILMVDRSGTRVHELAPDAYGNYLAADLTAIVPEVCQPSVVRVAVQRQPDTRAHFVLSDGTVAMLVWDKNEEVRCWCKITTNSGGAIEDVAVLPGDVEDMVYYVIRRDIDGSTVRYVEKWALSSETIGGLLNKQADSFIVYSGVATSIITGLSHLEGESVVCWGNGTYRGTFTVSGGQITLPSSTTDCVVGLPYTARFKSTALTRGAEAGSPLAQIVRVDHLALLLADTHAQGLRYGPDFDYMDDLPLIEDGAAVDPDTVHTLYDKDSVEFNGTYQRNSHICLEAQAPLPVTVLALVVSQSTHDKI